MMYNVLIVEDEILIAEGLKFLIERMLPECCVVGMAFDGLRGIRKAEELKPHIVLTDIRMPECDGLQMIKTLKTQGNPARFIILSGYAEFEYARTAITLGVEDYITKPVEEEELCAVFREACKSINKANEEQEQALEMEHTMKEYVMKDILDWAGADLEKKKRQLEELGFPVGCQWYNCIILENGWGCGNASLDHYSQDVEQMADRYLGFAKSRVVITYSDTMLVVVLALEKKPDYRQFVNAVKRFRLELTEKSGITVNGGIGLLHRNIEKIRKSFEEARCALNYKVIKGSGCMISYEEIRQITELPQLIEPEDMKKLEACIDMMDDKGCRNVIEEIFKNVEEQPNLTLKDLQLLSLNLVLMGIRNMPFMQFQLNEYLGTNILSLENISKFQTIEQLKNWIINMIKSMNELMLKEGISDEQDVVFRAKEYINKNFNKKVSLNDISERFYINPYYFSQLFKRKTGETYQNYITGLRINRAVRLLEETELNIYEVCEMVGYSDTNHFNKVFEKRMGMKPSEYKKRNHRLEM